MATRYRRGDHICGLYETEAEQLRAAAEYLAAGLRAGERIFYIAPSTEALSRFHSALADIGIEGGLFAERGALVQSTHATAHVAGGYFSLTRMLGFLDQEVEAALDRGFAGLRICGDMSWLLSEPPGAAEVVEYEALLNGFFQRVPAAAMCQYDRRRLAAHWVDHALATHPSVVMNGRHRANPFYCAPHLAVGRAAANADGMLDKLDELRKN